MRQRAAAIVGAYEHPSRFIPDKSLAEVHGEVAAGALRDAGLTLDDVDGYFCAGDAPGMGGFGVAEHLNLNLRYIDTTETGGSAPLYHVGHAAEAIAAGRCNVALITLAGLPRQPDGISLELSSQSEAPESAFEDPFGTTLHGLYALSARRHMFEFGTTSAQLAMIRVAASHHAQHNPNALYRDPVTVDDVLASKLVSDPLHRLDCCVISDGGGAIVMTTAEIADSLGTAQIGIRGRGEAVKHQGARLNITETGAVRSGAAAFEEARLRPADIQVVSIYDSFTITVLITLEDLGFCAKGEGGKFVESGALLAPDGVLPFNTDGGGLCNNHPGHRGGMTRLIEAVRQLRGQAHPAVQVHDCSLALVNGSGGYIAGRMGSSTLILERTA